MSAKLESPWSDSLSESWIDAIKRAIRSRPDSGVRRMLPLTPENVLALIYDSQEQLIYAVSLALGASHGTSGRLMIDPEIEEKMRAALEKAMKIGQE